MEKRVIVAAVICMFLLLVACESKTTGKRVAIPETSAPAITGNVVNEEAPSAPAPSTGETGKSAADALKEIQSMGSLSTGTSNKTGNYYPPVAASGSGKDILAAKTRALMNESAPDPVNAKATGEFGIKYYK